MISSSFNTDFNSEAKFTQINTNNFPREYKSNDFSFSGGTKYFCVRMLRKLLPDYPEDFIRRSYQYQYTKPIYLYSVTLCEAELLNRINSHHSRWTYSRQLFTALDELVRVSDFLPFYEHLRNVRSSASLLSNATVHALRRLLPQTQQTVSRSPNFMNNIPIVLREQPTIPQATGVQILPYRSSTEYSRENTSLTLRPVAPSSNVSRPPQQLKSIEVPCAVGLPSSSPQYTTCQQQQSIASVSNNTTNSTSTGN